MKTALRWLAALAGLALFGWFLYRADLREVLSTLSRLGWVAAIILVPYALVYVFDTLGWFWAFGRETRERIRFATLFWVRWAGEAFNNVIPSGQIGGEAVKVWLLQRRGVSPETSAASVVVGKTAQTVAQAAFVLLGAGALLAVAGGRHRIWPALVAAVAAGLAAVLALSWLQRRGLFGTMLAVAERLPGGRALRPKLAELCRQFDGRIQRFYDGERRSFRLSVGAFFLGWLLDTAEICLVAFLLGTPIHWVQALAVEAFIGVAKFAGSVVPGALGVQEAGIVVLCRLAGLPEVFGPAYAVIRRGREAIFAGIGWTILCREQMTIRTLPKQGANP